MSIAQDVFYNDVDDGTKLNLTTWPYIPTVYVGVRCGNNEVAIQLGKGDALDMAHRIINRFKVE